MADNFHLQRPDHVADESNAAHRCTRRHQRRRHRQKCVAGTHGVHYIFGERRNCMNDAAAFERDAAVLALRDYDFRAVEMVFSQLRAISPTFESRSLTASRASGASMQM
jgi:hypothetical protein